MSLGIYVHIPFCVSKCNYCAFVSKKGDELEQKLYVQALKKEIEAKKSQRKVDSIYFGGGTPTCLYSGALYDIMEALNKHFCIDKRAEINIEANPESIDDKKIWELKECAFNRVSIGMQTASDKLLRHLGRSHNLTCFKNALKKLRVNFDNINVDIMLGINGQTKEDIKRAIDLCKQFWLEHISVYSLSIEEGTRFYQENYCVMEDYSAMLYEFACSLLRPIYERYEVSNFARKGKECKHNLKYWYNKDYLGIGVSAHGKVQDIRYINTSNIQRYILSQEFSVVKLTQKDVIDEYIMLALRCKKGLDLEYLKGLGCDIMLLKTKFIEEMLDKGVLGKTNKHLYIKDDFFYVMNSIIVELLSDTT